MGQGLSNFWLMLVLLGYLGVTLVMTLSLIGIIFVVVLSDGEWFNIPQQILEKWK